MPRCLVTGAAGFLGYHLARKLADAGNQVVLVDNFIRGAQDAALTQLMAHPGVEIAIGDLSEQAFVGSLIGEFDCCYHMAALNGTQNFYQQPWTVLWNSTVPTLNLLEILVKTGRCGKFIYAGSSESYAGTVSRFNWPIPTGEDVPLTIDDINNPRWSYAAAKMHGEVATISACRQYGADFVIMRYHNAYGPRMGDKHVVPDFFLRALRGQYYIYGPEQTRSFLYVDDAVAATIALAGLEGAVGETINVGSGHEVRIGDLAEQMMRVLGRQDRIEVRAAPAGSVTRRIPDLSKIGRLVPSHETVPLDEGLRRTLAFYEKNSDQFPPTSAGFAEFSPPTR